MSQAEQKSNLPGDEAHRPSSIPLSGWWQIARRVQQGVVRDNLTLIAAGIAFFILLSIFPALTALVAIYGLVADPKVIQELVDLLVGVLPRPALDLLAMQLERLLSAPPSGLGLSAVASLVVLLWSGANGTQSLIRAINGVYNENETRSYLQMRWLALSLTVSGLALFIVFFATIAILPPILKGLGFDPFQIALLSSSRWPILGLIFIGMLAVIYRLAANRRAPKWRWVSPGSLIACLLWLAGSLLFSFYVQTFGNYSETYGSLGAVVVLLLWLYMSAFAVLLGAEVNAETEHQTARDSTIGEERPLGERGAWVADHRPKTEDEKEKKGDKGDTPTSHDQDRGES